MDVRDNGEVRIVIQPTGDQDRYNVYAMQGDDLKEGAFGSVGKDEAFEEASRLFDKFIIG